jgi:hypothetical protein
MRIAFLVCALSVLCAPALAQKKKPAPPPPASGASAEPPLDKDKKSKTYTFTGLDIDGKLRTPQLLYFLNRMKSEFDSTTPSKRSFIPELKRSTDEM